MEPSNQTPALVRLGDIRPGQNPRTYFNEAKMAEMQASIRAQGLLQPLLLRPVKDGFELIAGERRFRNCLAVYGEDGKVPALIKEMSDEAARGASLTENIIREPMTPVEEAEAASRVLGDCRGNREEAANQLGWTHAMLSRRLSLMHAIPKVREALQNRKIEIGHAELLAACRKEAQEGAIDALLAQPKLMTVADFKAHIERAALVLDTAIFDKGECGRCHHNSGNQAGLFGEYIAGGRCTNKECFDTKTEAELKARETALKADYQLVRIVRPGENLTLIPLVAEGPKGVGQEQAEACRVCQHFGAVVSAVPDKLGKTYKDICMDVPCNVRMVAARVAAEKAQLAVSTAESETQAPAAGQTQNQGRASEGSSEGSSKASVKAKPLAQTVKYPEPSTRVKEYREKLWRIIFKRVVMKLDVPTNRAVLLAIALTHPEKIDKHTLQKELETVLPVPTLARTGAVLSSIRDLDHGKLNAALQAIAANVQGGANGLGIDDVVSVLKSLDVKISDHWKVTKDFFELLTKNEIDAVCKEIGITKVMDAKYAKARGLGKEEFINAILNVPEFDYLGKIPRLVSW